MGRDPEEGDAFVFDLVDDDADEPDVPTSPADPAGAIGAEGDEPDGDWPPGGEPPASGDLGGKWRRAAPVAALLAIALGTGLAVEGVRDHARIERMRDIHGGLADVSTPLAETWAWDGVVSPGQSTTDVAVLGDLLAFESEGELVALDPATGEEAWTVPLGENPDCGPTVSARWADPVTASLVCMQGSAEGRQVIAVGSDGVASAPRLLDIADTRRYGAPHIGPDGTVLRAQRVGPPSAVDRSGVRCDESGRCLGTVQAGRDLVLRAEDAATGRERWTVTVPFRPAEAAQCTRTFSPSWNGSRVDFRGQLAPNAFGAWVTPDLVTLDGCGIEAAVTPGGVVLGTEFEPGLGQVTALSGGGYAGTDLLGPARATLYTADGDVVGEVTGYPLDPRSTDGSEPATILTVDEPARRLRAYEADGTPRWDIALQSSGQEFLAQVGETAVITTGAGTVRGLDLATGEEVWAWDGSDAASGSDGTYFGSAHVVQAFTDGESVLLLTEGEAGGTQGLVALDVASGAVLWQRAGGGPVTRSGGTDDGAGQDVVGELVAVDGSLMEVMPRGVRGLG